MDFLSEINEAIASGIEGFKQFILQKLQENKNYLKQFFWVPGAMHLTVLDYLVQQHQESNTSTLDANSSKNLMEFIDFIVSIEPNQSAGEPVHQAIQQEKILLAINLLQKKAFNVSQRDKQGRTLLSLALSKKKSNLLEAILKREPNIHEATIDAADGLSYQPLHEAIKHDFGLGIRLLVQAGANLENPIGLHKETPLLLAVRLGHVQALTELLECPEEAGSLDEMEDSEEGESEKNVIKPLNKLELAQRHLTQLHLEAEEDEYQQNAIEVLCQLFAGNKNKELIQGIAMLLCCGAEPPREEQMLQLLADNRADLLDAMGTYLRKRPEFVDEFVNRCHLADSPLHRIIYVDNSWGGAMRRLLGICDKAAFIVEGWVTEKYNKQSDETKKSILPIKAGSMLTGEEPSSLKYAEFVKRYENEFSGQFFANPFSKMRWMIAGGKCNWDIVASYARDESNKGTRTALIVNDMLQKNSDLVPHENLNSPNETTPSLISNN